MTKTTMVEVNYHFKDGYHLFTSNDINGLFIGSSDCEKAYLDVANGIEILMRANHNVECTALPMLTFEEFVAANGMTHPGETRTYQLKMAA